MAACIFRVGTRGGITGLSRTLSAESRISNIISGAAVDTAAGTPVGNAAPATPHHDIGRRDHVPGNIRTLTDVFETTAGFLGAPGKIEIGGRRRLGGHVGG